MPRKASPKEATTKKMLSWRESEDVIQAAVAISEAEDSNKQITFSALFRNGIALHDLQEEVRAYLKSQRIQEVERLEQSKDKWLRREAKSRRTMLTLYEPTDSEVIEFIRIAAKERMYGRVQREDEEASDEGERHASFPDDQEVIDAEAPVDGRTAVAKIGSSVVGKGGMDNINVLLRGVREDGGAWSVNLWNDTLQQAFLVSADELMDDGDSRISFQGDLAFSLLFSDGRLALTKSLLDGRTGEYEPASVSNEFLGISRPQAFVIEWLDGAIRIGSDGVTCYRLPRPVEIEADRSVIQYEGYAAIYQQGSEDVQMLHA